MSSVKIKTVPLSIFSNSGSRRNVKAPMKQSRVKQPMSSSNTQYVSDSRSAASRPKLGSNKRVMNSANDRSYFDSIFF